MDASIIRLPLERPSDAALAGFQEELFARYTEYCECLNFAPSTPKAYVQFIRNALKDLGLSHVWQIGLGEVRRYNLIHRRTGSRAADEALLLRSHPKRVRVHRRGMVR